MKYLSTLLIITVCLVGCGEGSEPDPTTTDLIQGTWTISNATRDGNDITSEFAGFSITFNNNSYTVTNGGGLWPSTGNWNPNGSPDFTSFTVSGNLSTDDHLSFQCEILNISESELSVAFQVQETYLTTGRVEAQEGSYQFDLTK